LDIQQKLISQVKLTRTTADRSEIVTSGSVVELQMDGLVMYGVESPLPPSNTYKNRKISQGWAGFGKDLLITARASGDDTSDSYPHRTFVAGEKCWVTGINVQKDGTVFQLLSDPYDNGRYYANLKIPFPKGPPPSADAVLQMVAQVLTAQPADDQSQQAAAPSAPNPAPVAPSPAGGYPTARAPGARGFFAGLTQPSKRTAAAAPAPTAAPYSATPAATPAPYQANLVPAPLPTIAPPAPPADAPPAAPKTIAIGQTQDEVSALFGQPARVAKLGPKEIYYYKDMKVTFTNGKVSNVE
jgi:hypothetical protein